MQMRQSLFVWGCWEAKAMSAWNKECLEQNELRLVQREMSHDTFLSTEPEHDTVSAWEPVIHIPNDCSIFVTCHSLPLAMC